MLAYLARRVVYGGFVVLGVLLLFALFFLYATPEDIAGPIVFLCSDLARHITGEVLNVNGGSVLCG